MRPLVNLSSRPFQNRRLFWLTVLLLFAVPSYFGISALGVLGKRQAELRTLDYEIQGLQGAVKLADKTGAGNATISPDRNLQLVAASELIARRAFSWSQLLDDMERNLPAGVRVLRVAVAQIQPNEPFGGPGEYENGSALNMCVSCKGAAD